MFPQILISKDKKQIEEYLNNFIKVNQFPSSSIFRYYPDPNLIKISQIREIQKLLIRADKVKKLVIIYDFDTAKIETQNAFLKTLEEKNNKAQFIIIVTDETQLLPTILSRCKIIKLKSSTFNSSTVSFSSFFSQPLSKLLADFNKINKEKAVEICDQFLGYFNNKIKSISRLGGKEAINCLSNILILKEILKIRTLILKNNLNPKTAIDHLLIFIYNCYNDDNNGYKNSK